MRFGVGGVVPSLGRLYRVGAVTKMSPWLEVDLEERREVRKKAQRRKIMRESHDIDRRAPIFLGTSTKKVSSLTLVSIETNTGNFESTRGYLNIKFPPLF